LDLQNSLTGDEIKKTFEDQGGYSAFLPYRRCALAKLTYYRFRSYRILGMSKRRGVKPPSVFKFFLNFSPEPIFYSFYYSCTALIIILKKC